MEHTFIGHWITDKEFFNLKPRDVFHKQLDPMELPCEEHRNRHILFRKKFHCKDITSDAKIFISADDYYKLYINGQFVGQGPAPSYHFQYNYNVWDVSSYLQEGENLIAVHTLYQGLINRVWQSGDFRHGLILDLVMDDQTILSSDESFQTAVHTAYTEMGTCGYETQFLEEYDSSASEVGFESLGFNDTTWVPANVCIHTDHTLTEQKSKTLVFERIAPISETALSDGILYDFGVNYVGYLCMTVQGNKGDTLTIRCAQELNPDGRARFELRANCRYEERWILTDGESTLDWFDYKAFRYAEILLPPGVQINDVFFHARHYPFALKAEIKKEYSHDQDLRNIWALCVNTQKYGVQEVIQDCMEREKGFYLGDGCYTALTNLVLTKDDSMVRKLIDDAFSTTFITDTLVTCMDCSFMQEIAEYPLILVYLVLWHYRITSDKSYLATNYPKVQALLDAYCRAYEHDLLLCDLDKWCVVDWPKNFRHDYDVDIEEGKICHEPHIAINAYYIAAVRTVNEMAFLLELPPYRDEDPLLTAFHHAFYDPRTGLFRDGKHSRHISLVGNSFVYGLGLCPDDAFQEAFVSMFRQHGIHSLSFFCSFLVLMGFVKNGRQDLVTDALLDPGAWRRILREDGTTTFEGWGRDTKWNTSLFHLTMSFAAIFLTDMDLYHLFTGR